MNIRTRLYIDAKQRASWARETVYNGLLDIFGAKGKSLVRHFPTTGKKIAVVFTKTLRGYTGGTEWVDDPRACVVELTPVKVKAIVDAYEDSLGETQYLTYQKGLPNSAESDNEHLNRPGLGQGIVDNSAGSWLERQGLANHQYQQYGPSQSFSGRRCGYKFYALNEIGRRIGEYLIQEGA